MPEQLSGGRAVEPRWFTSVRRGLFTALGLSLLGLAASGLYLVFRYRPNSPGAAKPGLHGLAETSHAVCACVALIVTILLIANVAVPAFKRSWVSIVAWALGSAALVGALWYGLAKGRQLVWNQAALWAVTIHTDLRGVPPTGPIRFFIVDGKEVSVGTFHRQVWIHIAVLPLVIGIAVALLVVASRRRRRTEDRSAPVPRDDTPERELVHPG